MEVYVQTCKASLNYVSILHDHIWEYALLSLAILVHPKVLEGLFDQEAMCPYMPVE